MVLYLSNSLHLTCFLDSPENQKLEVYSEILEVMFQGSFCQLVLSLALRNQGGLGGWLCFHLLTRVMCGGVSPKSLSIGQYPYREEIRCYPDGRKVLQVTSGQRKGKVARRGVQGSWCCAAPRGFLVLLSCCFCTVITEYVSLSIKEMAPTDKSN